MPSFAVVYYLKGSDQKPQEIIEADSVTHAGQLSAAKFTHAGGVLCPQDNEMIVVPTEAISYCHIRPVQERRKSTTRARTPFDDAEDSEGIVALDAPAG